MNEVILSWNNSHHGGEVIFIDRLLNALFNLHPLHMMVVQFPIVLTGAALFFILLVIFFNSSILEKVAFADMELATIRVIATGLTGI